MVRDWSKQDLSQPTLSSSLSLPSSLPLSPPPSPSPPLPLSPSLSLSLSLSVSLSLCSLSLSLPPASSGSMGCHGRKARPAGLVLLRPSWKSRSWRSFCKACCFPSSIRSVRMLGSSRTHTQAGNFLPHMDLTVLESVAHTKKESKGWEGAYCSEAEPKCLQAISSKPIAQASAAGFWNSASYPQHQKIRERVNCQLAATCHLAQELAGAKSGADPYLDICPTSVEEPGDDASTPGTTCVPHCRIPLGTGCFIHWEPSSQVWHLHLGWWKVRSKPLGMDQIWHVPVKNITPPP